MTDPYQVLGVSPDADAHKLRQRYLELVRQYSPEKSPQRFAEIRAAYDELRDPVKRLQEQILEPRSGDSLEDIIASVRTMTRSTRIPTNALLSMAER